MMRRLGRPPVGKKFRKPVTFRLTDAEYERLWAVARQRRTDISSVVRAALKSFCPTENLFPPF
jgi:hypothetical protein